jgi:mono/diheme cytochrome c family protein
VLAAALFAWIYSGAYDIGADAPHWRGTAEGLELWRERSIEMHAPPLGSVPNLEDAALIAKGATHYAEMCTGCHLAPGMADTELRQGLRPIAPKLAEIPSRSPAQQFWIVKHGLKYSGMPAWGLTHDDGILWGIVAFVQKLPKMSPEEYNNHVGAPATRGGPAAGGDDEHEHRPQDGGGDIEPSEEARPDPEPTRKEQRRVQGGGKPMFVRL